jgi:hypothetical protein
MEKVILQELDSIRTHEEKHIKEIESKREELLKRQNQESDEDLILIET